MQKIAQQQTVKSISGVSKALLELGFDSQLLASERYVMAKLDSLATGADRGTQRSVHKNKHTRFGENLRLAAISPSKGCRLCY
ncbi:MAG: hypothetical protein ACQCN3_11445 [Candidatus Bathyarchaeia archaeon]|jgi:hypothetical protein